MKKLFISQPMRGLTDEEILKAREEIRIKAEKTIGEPITLIDSLFGDFKPIGNIPVCYLGKSISLLAEADVAYFGHGWKDARGCKIEHEVAVQYGIDRIED
ncbi:DUF4406 domain-containing protein [Clostridium botulinum]|uniref:DUF4406 domain-containing protein n=1 Tax=Clostridium botulinum TaxID=1491 RepID=UPI000D3A4ED7|nr:hypothetical protein [Clostridium botulinum]AWB31533.1 hypothetical protein DBN47_15115 [Clostridium botulinum]MBY6829239.1 hypothetical protein [Clostridium botulinum]MBY6941488.1 hypothetical protein [Clostridium botulinum]MBY6962358.1 hypothetical protein [Clostridium botulinum]MBY6997566.1 hypothetical protein [Clostridium botulinum]